MLQPMSTLRAPDQPLPARQVHLLFSTFLRPCAQTNQSKEYFLSLSSDHYWCTLQGKSRTFVRFSIINPRLLSSSVPPPQTILPAPTPMTPQNKGQKRAFSLVLSPPFSFSLSINSHSEAAYGIAGQSILLQCIQKSQELQSQGGPPLLSANMSSSTSTGTLGAAPPTF